MANGVETSGSPSAKANGKPKVVGVIPARGGSKGVKNKHLIEICGLPVLAHVIKAAQGAKNLDEVVVCTEDDRIAELAQKCGVPVLRRPDEMATDTAPIDPTLRHTIRKFAEAGNPIDVLVWMQGNVPTLRSEVIDATVKLLLDNDAATSAQTVVPFKIPPQWAWRLDGTRLHQLEGVYEYKVRRQDMTPAFHLDGAVMALRRDVLMNTEGQQGQVYFGDHRLAIVQDELDSVEIDDAMDVLVCGVVLEQRLKSA